MKKIIKLFLPVLIISLNQISMADAGVFKTKLENGLTIVIKKDNRANVVTSQVWYKIGSSYEEPGSTGLSHVLEHMMFKGTKSIGPGKFSAIIAELGGSENAFTSRDYTAYFETLSADNLERALELEADRMQNLKLNQDEFLKEIEVVKEERRLRTDDRPDGLLFEQFMAVAWRASPYKNPVIGWMNDLHNMKLSDLQDWYERWYSPNNATLVIVGDVSIDETMALVRKHFGKISPSKLNEVDPIIEPMQVGVTRVEVEAIAKQSQLLIGFKVPVIGHSTNEWEPYALQILAGVLDGGDSSILSRNLIRKQKIAASVSAQYNAYSRLPNLFFFSGTPVNSENIRNLENAILGEIEILKRELITEKELERVIMKAISDKVYQSDSIFYQAMELGILETIGLDHSLLKTEIDSLKSITPENVRSVARKYFTNENMTVATLKPKS